MDEEQLKKIELLKKQLAMVLEPDAYERMMNIKNANIERFLSISPTVISLYKRTGRKVKDKELLMILKTIVGVRKEPKIEFRRK